MPAEAPRRLAGAALALRSVVFYAGFWILAAWFGGTGVLSLPLRALAPEWHRRYISLFQYLTVLWLRPSCGIRYRISGKENLPATPCVLLCQHQSAWETCAVPALCRPLRLSIVAKRELLRIPLFGWGLALIRPIVIDRGSPREALRKLMTIGTRRLRSGMSVLVFPEGTRHPVGELGRFSSGGAALAAANKAPVVPIAHNAGEHWPARRLMKYPGTIHIAIGPPLDSASLGAKEVTRRCRAWTQQRAQSWRRAER